MSGRRLGVSSQILPYSQQDILNADYRLNKFFLSTLSLAGKGLLLGTALSLFFIRKQPVIFYGMGFGAGLSVFHQIAK